MNILVINCGSSSLKYQLIDSVSGKMLAKGLVERIGIEGSCISHTPFGGEKVVFETEINDHDKAVNLVLEALMDKEHGVVSSLDEIDAIGHRVVHGGEKFKQAVIIDDAVMKDIEELSSLAPLHNPANITGIVACMKNMPGKPNIAVFDTAFHQSMPKKAYMYGIPYEYYDKYKIRRYGFHGTSHDYVSERAAALLGKKREDVKVIVCHLGNGASVSAVKNGACIDTSMGLTPLEGLIMGTRSGDIDPAVASFICEKENISASQMNTIFNKKSGVLGLSGGISADFRDLEEAEKAGNEYAQNALETFCYRVAKYIGAYMVAMQGVDIIAFTAGVGENSYRVRKEICEYLSAFGVKIDDSKAKISGCENVFTTPESSITVAVIPTNEELAIAKQSTLLLKM